MEQLNEHHKWPENRSDSGRDRIAQRAYELYQARGRESGHELEDWLQAEIEIRNQEEVIQSV